LYVAGDVTDGVVSDKAIALANGRLDGLILNAGILTVSRIANTTADEFRHTFNVNFFSVVDLVSKAIPVLRKQKGRVVFVSSGAGVSHYRSWGAYGGSKAALNHFAGTLAAEEPEIFSISVEPGVVDTDMQGQIRGTESHKTEMGSDFHNRFTSLKEKGMLAKPEAPAAIIANLAIRGGPEELNGMTIRYSDDKLREYR
jgi:NAD(P)-dependent dehydrogenase (short-subunit alcohol dehydrogenase family)